jgi:hypothetical protein
MAKPVAWSYSALNLFETCPYKYKQLKITKAFKDEMGPAGLWGDRVHKALERRVRDGDPLPEGMQQFEPVAARICASKGEVIAEQKVCLNSDFKPVTFFAKDAWVRGILDVSIKYDDTLVVLDYKLGKRKIDIDQLRLFAALGFELFPEVSKIRTGYLWLKTNQTDMEPFTRDQKPDIWGGFLPRVQRLERAVDEGHWPKKPNGLCRQYCPVLDCEYNGRRYGSDT